MTPVEIAERMYSTSLTARGDITASLSSPLTASSILAGGSALLMSRFEFLNETPVLLAVSGLFYVSSAVSILAVSCALLIIVFILLDDKLLYISPSRRERVKLEEYYEIPNVTRKSNIAESLDGKLTRVFLTTAEHNDDRNYKLKSRRRIALLAIVISILAFIFSVVLFGAQKGFGPASNVETVQIVQQEREQSEQGVPFEPEN